MKKLTLILVVFCLSTPVLSQSYTYYLPKKKLKVSVTYTLITSLLYKKTEGKPDALKGIEHHLIIKDPIELKEITTVNQTPLTLNRPNLKKRWASYSWSVVYDDAGLNILTGINATRESAEVTAINAALGFISNAFGIISASISPMEIARVAPDTYYVTASEQKITHSQIIDYRNNQNIVTIDPRIGDLPISGTKPSVIIIMTPYAGEDTLAAIDPAVATDNNSLYVIKPALFNIKVDVKGNGKFERVTVVDEIVTVPQYGELIPVSLQDVLGSGKKSLSVSINPGNGALTKLTVQKESAAKGVSDAINSNLAQLASAIDEFSTAQRDNDLRREIERLKLETSKLELEAKKRALMMEVNDAPNP